MMKAKVINLQEGEDSFYLCGTNDSNMLTPKCPAFPLINSFICWLFVLILSSGCSKKSLPSVLFEAAPPPPAPNYASLDAWAAHPAKRDSADAVPEGATPAAQQTAKADVFFIHPTTFYGADSWNASLQDEALNEATEQGSIRHQASVFNATCRVFAPRYRQMVLGGFYDKTPTETASKKKALMLAYEDVKQAFEHYLNHENNGRPIVIAGHSQGALHGLWLLDEYFDGEPLQDQLVVAYLPGWPIPDTLFQHLPLSQRPEQTGCLAGWSTFLKGHYPDDYDTFYQGAEVVNPLSWEANEERASSDLHGGLLMRNYKIIRRQKIWAEREGGMLWINRPHPLWLTKRYHVGDINIFWVNIRENVARRVDSFLDQKNAATGR